MSWLRFLGGGRRRRSPWNNVDAGGALTCGRLGQSLLLGGEIGPRDWDALSQAGVSVVVNMQQEQQDVFSADEKLDGYLWLPAPDGRAPSVEQLTQGVAFVQAAIRGGRRVFVHCKAGQGRAPLLCACYLIAQGASTMEAMKRVQQARPSTQLSPEQSARLREFALHLASLNPAPDPPIPPIPAASPNAPLTQTPFTNALAPSARAEPAEAADGNAPNGAPAPAVAAPAVATPAVATPAVAAPASKP